jgi:hypothetical protein
MKEELSLSLYKQHKELIRNQLIETTVSLFKEKGYDSVTVNEITMKIGIAKGTFYNFFSSKRDILLMWSSQQFQKIKTEELIKPEKTIEENLYSLVDTVYQLIRNEQKMFYFFLKETMYSNINDKEFDFIELLNLLVSKSIDYASIEKSNIEISINVVNSALFYEIFKWINSERPIEDLGAHLKNIIKVCLFGLYNKGRSMND